MNQSFDQADRILVLLRHGEAQASSSSGDEGRELTDRGREDVREAGRWLVEQGITPDVVVVSTATRTSQTWEELQAAGLTADDVRHEQAVYNGTVGDILEAVSAVPAKARTVVVVGHAPAVPDLAFSVEAQCDVPEGWAPAGLGVLSVHGPWDAGLGDDAVLLICRTPPRAQDAVG